jgi:hypothetical protein
MAFFRGHSSAISSALVVTGRRAMSTCSAAIDDGTGYASIEFGAIAAKSSLSPITTWGDRISLCGLSLARSADSCGGWTQVGAEDNCMPRLVQSLPSITAISVPCPQCGEPMNIKLVEPHPADSKEEKHTFECRE